MFIVCGHMVLPKCCIWNLSTNGFSNTWDFLNYAADQQADAMALQDVGVSVVEHVAFRQKSWHLGYRAMHAPGRRRRFWGGVVAVVACCGVWGSSRALPAGLGCPSP